MQKKEQKPFEHLHLNIYFDSIPALKALAMS